MHTRVKYNIRNNMPIYILMTKRGICHKHRFRNIRFKHPKCVTQPLMTWIHNQLLVTRFVNNFEKDHHMEWNEACHLLDPFARRRGPHSLVMLFSTIMMNISSWLPYLNFRSNILSIYFPHTSWFLVWIGT